MLARVASNIFNFKIPISENTAEQNSFSSLVYGSNNTGVGNLCDNLKQNSVFKEFEWSSNLAGENQPLLQSFKSFLMMFTYTLV